MIKVRLPLKPLDPRWDTETEATGITAAGDARGRKGRGGASHGGRPRLVLAVP